MSSAVIDTTRGTRLSLRDYYIDSYFVSNPTNDLLLKDIEVNVKLITENRESMDELTGIVDNFRDFGHEWDLQEVLHWFAFIENNTNSLTNDLIIFGDFLSKSVLLFIGSGLYPQFLGLNHSCSPNSALINNGLSLSLRAMKAIPSGQDITISRIDDLCHKKSERMELLKKYAIDCQKCVKNLDSDIDYEFMTFGRQMTEALNDRSLSDRMIADKFAGLVPTIRSNCDVIFGEYHPLKVIMLFTFVIMLVQQNCNQNLLQYISNQLMDSVAITYGANHPINQMIFNHIPDANK